MTPISARSLIGLAAIGGLLYGIWLAFAFSYRVQTVDEHDPQGVTASAPMREAE